MAFSVLITDDYAHMSVVGSDIIEENILDTQFMKKRRFKLGLATGGSPKGLYSFIAEHQRCFDASNIISFNLDEYIGLPGATEAERGTHPESYTGFMEENLFSKLNPRFAQAYLPPALWIEQDRLEAALAKNTHTYFDGIDCGKAVIIPKNCADPYLSRIQSDMDGYLAKIDHAGGIDWWIVGVGGRGHIGFHECGIPLSHEMLLVKLDDNTINNAVADGHFSSYEESPKYALSMGAAGICDKSRNILLLASGDRKAEPIAKSLLEDITSDVPISILQRFGRKLGHNVTYVIDEKAAAGIIGKEQQLRRKGIFVEDLR